MIAGGVDDISEEGSYEFANMKATSNAETEFAMGRELTEMSRPATTFRSGLLTLGSSYYSHVSHMVGYWCPYRYECEDCPRIRRSNPWCSYFHVNVNLVDQFQLLVVEL